MKMKNVVVIGILLLINSLSFSAIQYMPNIGEIVGDKEVRINQSFDDSQKNIRLEIYISNKEGNIVILVLNPKNEVVDAFKVFNNKIQKINKEYPNISGSWKIVLSPKNASGKYIIKLHNEMKYIGLTKDDEKILNNVYIWPIQ